jgi:hypothetical protein
LIDILKVVATGGMDTRRELYTTANVRNTPYQSKIWMTSNTASLQNESISNRMMIIDAGARTEDAPYRSEFYLEWDDKLRNEIWSDLVGRLSAAMVDLKAADEAGEGDLNVSHRMSSFFVFGLALAKASPRGGSGRLESEYLAAMNAMEERQLGAALEGNEIVELVEMVNPVHQGKFKPAKDWAKIFQSRIMMNQELSDKAGRTGWVAWQFAANEKVLTEKFRMVKVRGDATHKNIMLYKFNHLVGHGAEDKEIAADA